MIETLTEAEMEDAMMGLAAGVSHSMSGKPVPKTIEGIEAAIGSYKSKLPTTKDGFYIGPTLSVPSAPLEDVTPIPYKDTQEYKDAVAETAHLKPKKSIAEATVKLRLKTGLPGTTRKIGTEHVEFGIAENGSKIDKSQFRVTKSIFESPELDAVRSHDGMVRASLKRRAIPSDEAGGVYLIPIPLIAEVDKRMLGWEIERKGLIDVFLAAYPRLKYEAKLRLGDHYNPEDYPEDADLIKCFKFSFSYKTEDVPGALKAISKELFARETEKAKAQIESQVEKIRQAQVAQFLELNKTLAAALTPGEDGKNKKFFKSTIENYQEFVSYFKELNVTGDGELDALVAASEKIVLGLDAETMRQSKDVRDNVLLGVADMSAQVAALAETRGRVYSDEDEV